MSWLFQRGQAERSDGKPKRNRERSENMQGDLGGKPERNNERQRPSLARTSVILARRSPTEKLSLELGASTCLVQKNNLNAIARGLSASSELASERYKEPQRSERPRLAVHGALGRQRGGGQIASGEQALLSTSLRYLGREQWS